MEKLTGDNLIATFDYLVSEDVIVYGPHETVRYVDQGYPVCSDPRLNQNRLTLDSRWNSGYALTSRRNLTRLEQY
jgi:hypothetical protein